MKSVPRESVSVEKEQVLPNLSVSVTPESRSSPAAILPEEPLVTIEPSRSWIGINLRDLWLYRELLFFITWRDVKVRYRQTALGIFWVVLQPLLTTIIFTLFLGNLARVPSDDIPYPVFVYAGLLPWTFFASGVTSGSVSLVGSAHLITKVYFPRMIIPAAAVGGRLVDFAIAFLVFVGMMIYYNIIITQSVLMLPVLAVMVTLLTFGVGMWTSAMNVKYRDVGVAIPVLIQLWMFASPVVYPSSLVPTAWKRIYAINPVVGIIDGFRAACFAREFDWVSLAISTLVTLILLAYGAYTFRRMEKDFADAI